MPGLITHYICGQKVLAGLPAEIAANIEGHRKLFNIGCQGPDIFFYHAAALLKKEQRGVGRRMHNESVGRFMRAMAAGVAQASTADRDAAFAYFCGFLAHYALDCAAHPYVYYCTGFLREGEKGRGLKYKEYHIRFETAIDVLLLEMFAGKKPRDARLWKLIEVDKKEARQTAELVAGAINGTYDVDMRGKDVLSAMANMVLFMCATQSNMGLRKRLLGAAEQAFLRAKIITGLIHPQTIDDGTDCLNQGHRLWREPWDEASERVESFVQLLEAAVAEAAVFIQVLWEYAQGTLPLESFLGRVGDRSFTTGRPIRDGVALRAHDVVYRR
ncbi:MAG: zinc dependent phospholipase C family protein [Defluviitaleaceae bacterium]|nr:zinc dependent phospholipase C family protein [Defluviitaleaceae bacterium]